MKVQADHVLHDDEDGKSVNQDLRFIAVSVDSNPDCVHENDDQNQ